MTALWHLPLVWWSSSAAYTLHFSLKQSISATSETRTFFGSLSAIRGTMPRQKYEKLDIYITHSNNGGVMYFLL
jgi:hypothetical protein